MTMENEQGLHASAGKRRAHPSLSLRRPRRAGGVRTLADGTGK